MCNNADDDCDSAVDKDPTDVATWYADADSDGFADSETARAACDQPAGYIVGLRRAATTGQRACFLVLRARQD